MKCYYLASPYSHRNPAVVAERAALAAKATVHLLTNHKGVNIFSPIVHSHVLHQEGMKGDWLTWKAIDCDLIERMDGLVVLRLAGWEDSVGVNEEIEFARKLKLPIFALDFSLNSVSTALEFSKLKIFRDE